MAESRPPTPLGEKLFKPYFSLFLHPLLPSSPSSPSTSPGLLSFPFFPDRGHFSPSACRPALPPLCPSATSYLCHPFNFLQRLPHLVPLFISGLLSRVQTPFVFSCLIRFSLPLLLPLQRERQPRRRPVSSEKSSRQLGQTSTRRNGPNARRHASIRQASCQRGPVLSPNTNGSNVSFLNEFEMFNHPVVIIYFSPLLLQ